MPSVFSKLRLNPAQIPGSTIAVLSPLDGQLQPAGPDWPAADSGLLADQMQLALQGNQLRAPFAGAFLRTDNSGTLLSFLHSSGLRLDLAFAAHCCKSSEGYHYLVPGKAKVAAGQLLAELDLARLQRYGKASCLLSIQPADTIRAIYARTGFIRAGHDAWCWLELHSPIS